MGRVGVVGFPMEGSGSLSALDLNLSCFEV